MPSWKGTGFLSVCAKVETDKSYGCSLWASDAVHKEIWIPANLALSGQKYSPCNKLWQSIQLNCFGTELNWTVLDIESTKGAMVNKIIKEGGTNPKSQIPLQCSIESMSPYMFGSINSKLSQRFNVAIQCSTWIRKKSFWHQIPAAQNHTKLAFCKYCPEACQKGPDSP